MRRLGRIGQSGKDLTGMPCHAMYHTICISRLHIACHHRVDNAASLSPADLVSQYSVNAFPLHYILLLSPLQQIGTDPVS